MQIIQIMLENRETQEAQEAQEALEDQENQDIQDIYDEHGREIRAHGSALFPAAYYSANLSERSIAWHWHDEFEVGYVTQGRVALDVGSQHRELCEGEGFFINLGVLHAFNAVPGFPGRLKSIVFGPSLIEGRTDSVFWQRYLKPVAAAGNMPAMFFGRQEDWHAEAVRTLDGAWSVLRRQEPEYELALRYLLSHFLYLLTRHLPEETADNSGRSVRENERIKLMLSYIREHFAEPLTTEDIARSAMISASECLRCFHNVIGTTPIQYSKQYRIIKASHLLQTTELRITEIGERCGFHDMSYFAKTFREVLGCSPGEYRRQLHA